MSVQIHDWHMRQKGFASVLKPFLLCNKLFFPPFPHRAAQIELLHALANIAAEHNLGQGVTVKIKFNIIASLYDYNPNLAAFMKVRVETTASTISSLVRVVRNSPTCSSVAWHVEEMSGLYRRAAEHPVWKPKHLHWREHRRGQRDSDHLWPGSSLLFLWWPAFLGQ